MSRRIRTIKPEILDDDKTAGLSHVAWRLFVSGLTLSDDHGNLRAGVTGLAGQVFHSCPFTDSETVRTAVEELVEAGLWQVYTVRGQTYAHIRGWSKHQRIDNAGKPRVPTPGEADGTRPISAPHEEKAFAANRGDSRRTAATRGGSRLDQDQDHDQEGTRKGTQNAGAGAPAYACTHEGSPDTSPAGHVVAEVVSTEPPPSRTPPAPVEVVTSSRTAPSCPVVAPLAASAAEDDDEPPPAQRVPSTPRPGASVQAASPVAPATPSAPVVAAPPVEAPVVPVAAPSAPTAPTRGKAKPSAADADIVAVFEHWRDIVWKGRAVLNDQRRARIAARLAEGFTVDDLKRAVDGASKDDWLMGRDEKARQGGWRDVETVFRHAGQVERLMLLAPAPRVAAPPAPAPTPKRPPPLPPHLAGRPAPVMDLATFLARGLTAPEPRRLTEEAAHVG